MPLKKGGTSRAISGNIRELVNTYEEKGKIGNIRPRSKKHAMDISAAIAYKKAKRGKTNPIDQGESNAPMGMTPGGACPKGMPFLRKK